MTTLEQKLIAIRRHLHQNPELSNQEFETTAAIRTWLEEADITILDTPLQTGLLAEIQGETDGPIIALRADIDALPIQEESGLPFASTIPGKMHACGHDFHTASILGAAYLLKQKQAELRGTVRFIFQPAEENGGGALQVIETGGLDGIQAIFGMHNKPDLPVGTIGITSGALMASVDGFRIDIEGVGTHAAVPDNGIDPIVTAAHLITALQTIVSRNISSLHNAVISVASIHGGSTWNVIPPSVTLEGTVRTFQEEVRQQIPGHIKRVIEGVAATYGANVSLHWHAGPPPVQNDEALTNLAIQAAQKTGLDVVKPTPSPAGEDFAFYQEKIPGVFVFMGTSGTQEWHHPAFTVDERALLSSAQFFAVLAEKALAKLTSSLGLL
ncbi:M20 peptidase aminoacylase family protein [Aneurinibacillus uraniidurans]|uniref:M20 peptidase aminoacylase family protein n=1 Tax=Aneurinibacillus uraniidurans TaxID=2966586 RepID=UPI00234B6E81|nr:M20 peptidase aminoacylase family protein [Aneurinibacillus sp. B1]WCN36440.1 M20 peptidase aminoacylase family protein [Aneurinibacillus sp. B1]